MCRIKDVFVSLKKELTLDVPESESEAREKQDTLKWSKDQRIPLRIIRNPRQKLTKDWRKPLRSTKEPE